MTAVDESDPFRGLCVGREQPTTAMDRPDNGQDEGRQRIERGAALALATFEAGYAAGLASGRAGVGEQQREQVAQEVSRHGREWGRRWDEELCTQWCLCGWLDPQPISKDSGRLDGAADRWRLHVADELLALLGGPQPDDDPGPQCPSTSHGTDGGWRCAVDGPHEQHHNAAGDVTW